MPRPPARPLDPAQFSEADRRRFWAKVDVKGRNDCWQWSGACHIKDGYGVFPWRGSSYYAHRWSLALELGELDPQLVTDHLCRNRRCVNPRHLELVSHKTNIGRGVSASAAVEACPKGHRYTAENTYLECSSQDHSIRRVCRQCKLDKMRARAATAEWKERQREYRKETRESRRAYEQSPEFKARRLERERESRARMTPEQRAEINAKARAAYHRRKDSAS